MELTQGIVIKSTGKNYLIQSGKDIFSCTLRGKLRLVNSRKTNPVAVGDHVQFYLLDDENTGLIEKVEKRRNHLLRKSTNLSKQSQVIAANIDQAVLIATLNYPKTTRLFIDRFIVSAESFNIPVVLVFNKVDLYDETLKSELDDLKAVYNHIVAAVHVVSAVDKQHKPEIQRILKDKISVVAGHSGVGKSSFINLADPKLHIETNPLSKTHQTGKHTTTFAEMHSLDFGGYVIDTPGIKAFGISHIDKTELYHFFPEMFAVAADCKFYNCLHIDEPGCAVKQAVIDGEIAESRYYSYLNLFFDDRSKYRAPNY
ncbi:MAG: ribosome small subunit-dependent GTPase A [Candidatus Delongbacteria bacterium]|nr:ribosome small subunit-dependent GTPase A [Candidatus Delongbacteria bacterium]